MSKPTLFDGPVVVVGGGVAGLVTAHLLAEAGAQVVVIEKFSRVGGLARSYQYDGFVFDCGPHRFHTENPNVKSYLDRVLEGQGTWFPRKSEVYFAGQYYRWPLHPKNLVQLPPALAAKSAIDLAINGMKTYGQDNFEDYVLRQYGPTLYEHFFKGYSIKFLGIHPKQTHPDWAKVGLNRAIIDDKLQMQNLAQLAKSTLLQYNKAEIDFLYPKGGGLQVTWDIVAEMIKAKGGRIITGTGARQAGGNGRIEAVYAGSERIEPSLVIWTAPITLACDQLNIDMPDLPYLSTLFYNVMVDEDVPRKYQWCYYGADDIVFNEGIRNGPAVMNQIPRTRPGSFFGLAGGALGYSGGSALGAKLASPERNVIQIVGDGAFYFGNPSSVYAVAKQYRLPIFTVVLDNSGWSAVKEATLRVYPDGNAKAADEFHSLLAPEMEFGKVAEAAGGYGETVTDPDAVPAAIQRCLKEVRGGRAAVMNVRIPKI